jgi:putative spermidine/putrescine transport system substrate-binding protein
LTAVLLTRRELVERAGLAAAAGPLALSHSPDRATSPPKPRLVPPLRVVTVGVEWPAGVHEQAQLDLGFPIQLQVVDSVQQVDAVLASPKSFDVFGGYGYQAARVWFTGHLQPVDTRRIAAWSDLYKLFAWGKLTPGSRCPYGVGDAPFRTLFVRKGTRGLSRSSADATRTDEIVQWIDERTDRPHGGAPMPRYVVGVPAHFAAESLGYLPDVILRAPSHVSWAELLNPRWRGRVAIQDDPAVALVDLGRAAQSLGIMRFGNVAAMTVLEVEMLTRVLGTYRKQGQFRAAWSTFNDSVNLVASKDVAIAPLWPSAAARIAAEGVRVRYAVPPEGYRGSSSTIGIAAHVRSQAGLDRCYAYLNWLHAGFFGATMMRQGYYVANGGSLERWIRRFGGSLLQSPFTTAEFGYWYAGRPAAWALPDVKGASGAIRHGDRREGGSLSARMCRCTAWSSYFHAAGYQAKRFKEFLSA